MKIKNSRVQRSPIFPIKAHQLVNHIDVKADQVGNEMDNTGENGKNIKKPYPIFDISSMSNIGYDFLIFCSFTSFVQLIPPPDLLLHQCLSHGWFFHNTILISVKIPQMIDQKLPHSLNFMPLWSASAGRPKWIGVNMTFYNKKFKL